MRKLNIFLVILIVGVLVVPSVVVAKVAEACCGVIPVNLVADDQPDPVCEDEAVTISGTYSAIRGWPGETFNYDTGIEIRVVDSANNTVASYNATVAENITDPGPQPAADNYTFSWDWPGGAAGTYTYEVIAWTDAAGREDIQIIGQTITVEDCVDIDIKPGSFPNSINLKGKGSIPVAILGSAGFDATTVDASTATFGPGAATKVHKNAHLEDVNGDGFIDMVLHFKTQDAGLSSGDTQACLTFTDGSKSYTECDSVNIVPK